MFHKNDDNDCMNTELEVKLNIRIPNFAETWNRIDNSIEVVRIGKEDKNYRYYMTERTFKIDNKNRGAIDPIIKMKRSMKPPIYLREEDK